MAKIPVILALLASLVLAACGPAPDTRPVLKVASQKGGTKSLVLASGVLEGAPYRVEWSEFPSAQTLLEALGAGAVDLGAVGDAPFLFAYANNPKLRVVQAYETAGAGGSTAIVVPEASPLKVAADLKGHRVATGRGSIGHYLLLRLLEREGLKPTDVQLVLLNPGDAKSALASGAVDAWSTWGSYIGLARLHGNARVLADGQGLLNAYGFEASTTASISAKRPQIADFLSRLAKAERWQQAHVADYAAALSKETGLPADVALDTVQHFRPQPIEITPAVEQTERKTLATFARAGVISTPPAIDGAFDTSFNAAVRP